MSEWCYRLTRRAARTVLAPWVSLQVWRLPGAVEEPGAALLIANHISHFDPVLLCVAFTRPIDWMTTEEFYANPIGAAWLRGLNTFPVDRSRPDRRALRLGMERLRAGRLVGVFPEGGIRAGPSSIIGGTAPKRGATALARLAKVPIIPSVIFGSDRLYAVRSWSPLPPRVPVWIAVGPSFSVGEEDDRVANENLALGLRQLADQAIAHFDLTPADLPASPQHRKGRDNLLPNE
jgi:1-acyl-sn-glycerol-3-phosphate acyltransferase